MAHRTAKVSKAAVIALAERVGIAVEFTTTRPYTAIVHLPRGTRKYRAYSKAYNALHHHVRKTPAQ